MEFLCRVCGRQEGEPQGWHLVIELAKPGTDIRNTILFSTSGTRNRRVNPTLRVSVRQSARKDILPTGIADLWPSRPMESRTAGPWELVARVCECLNRHNGVGHPSARATTSKTKPTPPSLSPRGVLAERNIRVSSVA